MKIPKNKKPQLKAQESSVTNSNNYSRGMEASKKTGIKKNKRYLREKQNKKITRTLPQQQRSMQIYHTLVITTEEKTLIKSSISTFAKKLFCMRMY